MSIRSYALMTAALLSFGLMPEMVAAQQFQQPAVIPTGNWPAGVVTADVNGDGKPDLIYTDYGATPTSSTTHILLGNGDGTFTPGQTIATAGASIAVADFNHDGRVDLEWVWGAVGMGEVWQALGNGDGTFAPAQELGTFAIVGTNAPQFSYVMGAQLHSTGYLDLLVEDAANPSLLTLTSDSSGTLVRIVGTKLRDGVGPMSVADLNGDGNNDLVIQAVSGGVADVFLGSADGTGLLGAPASYAGSSPVQSALLHDADGDGHPDLVLEGTNGRIEILRGRPDGSFATVSEGGSGSGDGMTGMGGHLVAMTDVAGLHNLYTTTPAGMSVLLGQNNLSFTLQGIYNAGPGRTRFAVADFNGDGFPDIAVDSPEGVAILFGNADGSLRSSRAFAAGKPALSGALGSFSGTGNLDAVVSVAATQAQLLHGNGDGTFAALSSPTTSQVGGAGLVGLVATGDFNGDGRLDLLMTQSGVAAPAGVSGLSVQYGNGDGTFGAVTPVTPGTGTMVGTSVTADLNGDGIADVANVDQAGDHVLLGQSGGGFKENDYQNGKATSSASTNLVAAGDLNGDGKADFISQDGGTWTVYLNAGSGNFSNAGSLPGLPQMDGMVAGAVTIADLDGDGNADVVIAYDNASADHAHPAATASNAIYIWYGNGDGTFAQPVVVTPSRNFYELVVADVNGDGQPDLVMSDGYVLSVQLNQGGRVFGAETHFLAGMGINTISTGDLNKDGFQDLLVANGGAALSNPAINLGTLGTNADVNTGGVTVLLNMSTEKAVSGKLTAAPNATLYGQTFTITAAVTPPAGGPAVTGTVVFAVDGTTVGTATVAGGVATITGPGTIAVGKHTLSAQYSGNATYAETHLNATHAVTGVSTNIVLTVTTPSTIYFGQFVDGYADVTSSDGSTLSGTITFFDGAQSICVIPVTQSASCPASTGTGFVAGIHVLSAVYSGDTSHSGSTSNAVTVTVLQDSTATSLMSSANPAASGQNVMFTASVHGAHGTPSGMVTFFDGSGAIGTGTLNSAGVATMSTSTLAAGSHQVTAVYAGTANSAGSSSAVVNEVVSTAPEAVATATMLASNVDPAASGQSVTFTATVFPAGPSLRAPTGVVTFLDGSVALGTGTLNGSGVATFSTASLSVGSHNLTASYAGDGNAAASVSAVLTETVTGSGGVAQSGFSLTVTGSTTVAEGQTANLTVAIAPVQGYAQPVQLSCADLPAEAACTFGAQMIPGGGGTTTLLFSTTAPHQYGSSAPLIERSGLPFAGTAVAGLVILFIPRKKLRKFKGLLIALVALCGMAALTGCGISTDLGTRPGTYTIKVIGTAAGTGSGSSLAGAVTTKVTIKVIAE